MKNKKKLWLLQIMLVICIFISGCKVEVAGNTVYSSNERDNIEDSGDTKQEDEVGESDFTSESKKDYDKEKKEYGVFIGSTGEDLDSFYDYQLIVIDAQYFTKEQIDSIHEAGVKVYSYLNIGSIENFREYYEGYLDIALGDYEHWEDEKWIDVSNKDWQQFILSLANSYLDLGIDGYFVDNCDVYTYYKSEEMYQGVRSILSALKEMGLPVVINGGDVFITEAMDREEEFSELISGVNQECVFSAVDFANESFMEANREDTDYYLDYLSKVEKKCANIYIIEYCADNNLKNTIYNKIDDLGYKCYITDSLELN